MRITRSSAISGLLASTFAFAAIVCGARDADADTNPFAVGKVDNVTCVRTPVLHLSIANTGSIPTAQYAQVWTSPILHVAYLKANGTDYYPIQLLPLPNIAPGSETTFDIPLQRNDTTYKVAITASGPTGTTVSLLKITSITPSPYCMTAGSGGPIAQAPTLKPYAPDVPTNLRFVVTPLFVGQADIAFDYAHPQQIDGYRLYRMAHGTRSYVSSLAGATAVRRLFRVTKMTAGDCYDIVTVRHSIESAISASICLK